MKIINVPQEVTVMRNNTEIGKMNFKRFGRDIIENTEMFGKGIHNIRLAVKLLNKLEDLKDTDTTIQLEDEEYNVFKSAMNTMPWVPFVGVACLPFMEAIEKAEEIKK